MSQQICFWGILSRIGHCRTLPNQKFKIDINFSWYTYICDINLYILMYVVYFDVFSKIMVDNQVYFNFLWYQSVYQKISGTCGELIICIHTVYHWIICIYMVAKWDKLLQNNVGGIYIGKASSKCIQLIIYPLLFSTYVHTISGILQTVTWTSMYVYADRHIHLSFSNFEILILGQNSRYACMCNYIPSQQMQPIYCVHQSPPVTFLPTQPKNEREQVKVNSCKLDKFLSF